MSDNLFDQPDAPATSTQGQSQNLFDQPQATPSQSGNLFDTPQPADANLPPQYNFGDAMRTLASTFNPAGPKMDPNAQSSTFLGTLSGEASAMERYPQGIMQTAQDLSKGQSPNLLQNFFSPNPNPKDATAIAQDMGDAAIPPAVIANPNSHLDYMKAFATNFIKDLPFTTAGTVSEFANPNNAFLAGAISGLPHVNIAAPAWVDNSIQKIIDFAGGPFKGLNDALKDQLADHLADSIHDKVQNAPGWLDQFKRVYGEDTTSDDVRDMIKNKVDQAVQNTSPNAIQLAQAIIKVKGSNLPGIMVPSKALPPGALPGDQWTATDPNAPLTEKPLADVVPASMEVTKGSGKGAEVSSSSLALPSGIQQQMHLSQIQNALNVIGDAENKRVEQDKADGKDTTPINVPQANALPPTLQAQLIKTIQDEIEKPEGNDKSVQEAILKVLGRDNQGNIDWNRVDRSMSAESIHEHKEDSYKTEVDDWLTFNKLSAEKMGELLRNENIVRKAGGWPLVDPKKDITFHKMMYPDQQSGTGKGVTDAIALGHDRAKINPVPPKPSQPNLFDQMHPAPPFNPWKPVNPWPNESVPAEPSVMDIAQRAGEHAQANLFDTSTGTVGPAGSAVSPSAATSPTALTHLTAKEANNAKETSVMSVPLEDKDLPQPVHVAHDIYKVQTFIEQVAVKDFNSADQLNKLISTMKLTGTPEERLQAIADASGLTVDKIMALTRKAYQELDAPHEEAVLRSALTNEGVSYVTDKHDALSKSWQLFQEWYKVRTDPQNLPQPKDFNNSWSAKQFFNKKTGDIREKGVDSVSEKVYKKNAFGEVEGHEKQFQTPDESKKIFKDPLGLTKEGISKEEQEKAIKKMNAAMWKSTKDFQKQVLADHAIYDKFYLDEIDEAITGLPDDIVHIVTDAMAPIRAVIKSGLQEIERPDFNMTPRKYMIYKSLIEPWRISQTANKIKESLDKERSKISGGHKDLEDFTHQGVDIEAAGRHVRSTLPGKSLSKRDKVKEIIIEQLDKEKSYDEIQEEINKSPDRLTDDEDTSGVWDKNVIQDDTDYEQNTDIKNSDESGQTIAPHEWLKKIVATKRVYKWGPEERVSAIPTILNFMRQFPWVTDLQEHFILKSKGEEGVEQSRLEAKARFSAAGAKGAVYDYAQYENQVRTAVRQDLQQQFNSEDKALKEFFKKDGNQFGLKMDDVVARYRNAFKDEKSGKIYQKGIQGIYLMYHHLMDDAAELVVAKDPVNYAFGYLAGGAHKPGEMEPYVRAMMQWYDALGIKYSKNDVLRWQMSRTPDLWHLLAHPQVMNGNVLQRIILFNKAAVTNPVFDELRKRGEYKNTNIAQQIADGYQPHYAVKLGEQSDLAGADSYFREGKNPLAKIANPKQIYTSKQAFREEVKKVGMRPVDDYWLNTSNYLQKNLMRVQQHNLTNELAKIPMPRFEPISDAFIEMEKNHPLPQNLHDNLKMVEVETSPAIQKVAEHYSLATGREITPLKILQEGGWIQEHQDTAFASFYRGFFQKPYVYRTLNDMLKTVFTSNLSGQGFDTKGVLGGLLKTWLTLKQIKIGLVPVHYPQMVGNIISGLPFNPITKVGLTLKISTYDFAKAFWKTRGVGKQILQGTYDPSLGDTAQDRMLIREFMEAGSVIMQGYHGILQHTIGKADPSIFPQMTPPVRRWWNLALAGGGTGPALLGEQGGWLAAKLMAMECRGLEANGMSHKEAVRFVVDKFNSNMYMTNEAMWRGNALRPLLQMLTFSPDFATKWIQVTMAALQTPIGGAMYGGALGAIPGGMIAGPPGALAGALLGIVGGSHVGANLKFSYKTGGQSIANIFTGAHYQEQQRDKQYAHAMWGLFSLLVGSMMFYGVQQLGNYLRAKAQGKNPDPSTALFWNNPYEGTYFNQQYDENGKGEYIDWNRYRLIHDWMSGNADIIDADYKAFTGKDADGKFGVGFLKFNANKFSLAFEEYQRLMNHDPQHPYSKVFDDTHDAVKNWLLMEGGAHVPINPWLGSSSIKDKYDDNFWADQTLKASTMFGQQVKTRSDNSDQLHRWEQDVAHEEMVKKGMDQPMNIFQGGADTPETPKQRNINNYFKRHRRDIWAAEAAQSSTGGNLFDDENKIENPENE